MRLSILAAFLVALVALPAQSDAKLFKRLGQGTANTAEGVAHGAGQAGRGVARGAETAGRGVARGASTVGGRFVCWVSFGRRC